MKKLGYDHLMVRREFNIGEEGGEKNKLCEVIGVYKKE